MLRETNIASLMFAVAAMRQSDKVKFLSFLEYSCQ